MADYSAGRAILDVVPSFEGVQNAIAREVRKMEAALGKASGDEFGKNFEKQANRAVDQVLGTTKGRDLKVNVKVDDREVGRFERDVRKRIESAIGNIAPIKFNADVTPAQNQIMKLRQQMVELGDKNIGVDLDASAALAEMERIRVELAKLSTDRAVDVQVRTDAAGAARELVEIRGLAELVDNTKVKIDVKLEDHSFGARIRSLRQSLLGAGSDGEDAANGFRAFNGMVLAGATLLPAAVPAITALAGGLALIGPLALGGAAGLGVLGFAFSGVQDAVSALGKVQDTAAKDSVAATRTMATASRGVEDAERSLGRAREDAGRQAEAAARQVADAVDAQEDAERNLVQAQQDVVRAQEAVTRAREEAIERIEDLQLSIRGGALAERAAVLDLKDAQLEYDKVTAAGSTASADERERAAIALEKEKLNLDRVREANGDMAEEQAEFNRTGVEGSREVLSAQEQLAQAQEGVRNAMEGVADAAQAVGDAVRAQQQTNADSARAISDAQRGLTEAQQAYSDALYDTGVTGSASMQALEVAMGKLGPAGQGFAVFLAGLMPQFRELRNLVQAGLFPGLQEAISNILTTNGPMLATFMSTMGTVLGGLFREFGDMMTSPQWMGIWATFSQYAPIFMQQFGEVGMAMLTFFGELFQALAPYSERFGEALVRLAVASAEWMAAFVDGPVFREIMEWLFTNGPVVFEAIWNIARAIGNILVALEPLGMLILGALSNIAGWIASMDPAVLGGIITAILGLVVAFQLAAAAISLVAGLTAILTGGISLVVFAVMAGITALVILYTQSETARDIIDGAFKVIGNVAMWLFDNVLKPAFEWFIFYWGIIADAILWVVENVWIPLFTTIGDAAVWLFDNALKPAFDGIMWAWDAMVAGFKWAWENVLSPVWEVLKAAAQIMFAFLTVVIFGPMLLFWSLMAAGFEMVWNEILYPLWEMVKSAGQALLDFLQPVFDTIAEGWEALLVGMKWIYDNIIYPYIIEPFKNAMGDLKDAFGRAVEDIGIIWGWLQDKLAKPVNFVIKYILNEGLFGAFNWIVETLGLDPKWKIADWNQVGPASAHLAAGGRVPGWSPNDRADNIPAMLTANEFVHPVDAVDYYGLDTMELIRKKKIPREILQYRATGGQIFDFTRAAFPRAKLNSAYRAGDPGYHGRNMAADMGESGFSGGDGRPYIASMKRWWVDNFGGLTNEIIYNGLGNDRTNVKNGAAYAYSAATQAEHHNHLHVALERAITALGAAGGPAGAFAGAAASGTTDVTRPAWMDIFPDALSVLAKLKDSVVAPIAKFGQTFGENKMVQMISAMPGKAVDFVWGKIKDSVQGLFDLDNGVSNDLVIQQAGGVQNVVKAVADRYGWGTGGEWDNLYALIQKESSWNPKAQNPTSTAYGLFQFLDSTWASVGATKTSDPAGQAQAGLKYIANRYGTPSKAWAFHKANNWYSEGGRVEPGDGSGSGSGKADAPTLYDTGGWLPPGVTTVLNATNKPEPILTSDQWDRLTAGDKDTMPTQIGVRVFLGTRELTDIVDVLIDERAADDRRQMRST